MATDTKTPTTGVSITGWSLPGAITTNNNSCASSSSSGSSDDINEMYGTFPSSSIGASTITAVKTRLETNKTIVLGQASWFVYFSKDSGSNYCAGHSYTPTTGSSCSFSQFTGWITCSHTGFGGDLTYTEWNTANMRLKIRLRNLFDTSAQNIDFVELAADYTPGYGNKVMGVASANIAKVNGVATANIAKVIGVA